MITFDTDRWGLGDDQWDEDEDPDLSEEQIQVLVRGHMYLEQKARDYAQRRFASDPSWQKMIDAFGVREVEFKEVTIDLGTVRVRATRYAGGGEYDGHTYEFPLSYLWLDQTAILADMKAKDDARKKALAEADARRKAEAQAYQEKEDLRRLAELSAKYPNFRSTQS
jgi:hypothetical protein